MTSTCHSPTPVAYLAWIVGIVVVVALVYLGCNELGRSDGASSALPAARAGGDAGVCGRRTVSASKSAPQNSEDAFDASFAVETKRHMAKVDGSQPDRAASVQSGSSDSVSSQWEDSWSIDATNAQAAQFRPVNKEGARRGANTSGLEGIQMQRDACRPKGMVDVVGALRPQVNVPLNVCGVTWGDSDCRQVIVAKKTDCWNRGNCPWDSCK